MVDKQKDILLATIVGLMTGFITAGVLLFLAISSAVSSIALALPIAMPIIFIMGIYLGRFLGRWYPFFKNFARFTAIGFSNAAIDFGILNLLIFKTNITQGFYFSVFKTFAFLVALINSYIWNKFWTFDAGKSGFAGGEIFKFIIVVGISLIINVGVSTVIVSYIPPLFNIDIKLWVNIATALAVVIGLFWNFIGMKVLVFKD